MPLTLEQQDALTEVVNIGVGRAAASLCDLIDRPIELKVPRVCECSINSLRELGRGDHTLDTSVAQDFSGSVNGRAVLAFPRSSGVLLASTLGEQQNGPEFQDELDLDLAGILEEVGNIVLNAVLGSMANLFQGELFYSVPRLESELSAAELIADFNAGEDDPDPTFLVADAHFRVAGSTIDGTLLLAFGMEDIQAKLDSLLIEA